MLTLAVASYAIDIIAHEATPMIWIGDKTKSAAFLRLEEIHAVH
jgi:hypothetical protein